MKYFVDDIVYKSIIDKIECGIYTKGKNYSLPRKYYGERSFYSFPYDERTEDLCASMIAYDMCTFEDVPLKARTRRFFLTSFTDKGVFEYIKNYANYYDREFYKDLIESNRYACTFRDQNAFEIMPLEFIDEEMCALALINNTDWSSDGWVRSIIKRKPEVLNERLWSAIVRFYSRSSNGKNEYLEITPSQYKTQEYYLEMCRTCFNCGLKCQTIKGKIMETIPTSVLTPNFLRLLLTEDLENVARFSEYALEQVIEYNTWDGLVREPIWQYVIKRNGYLIKYIELNNERIEFFMNLYPKNSNEYDVSFKNKYKEYMSKKSNEEEFEKKQERIRQSREESSLRILFGAMMYSHDGINPMTAVDDESKRLKYLNGEFLPIKYTGMVPSDFRLTHDKEEYLKYAYETLGIKVLEEYDDLFYRVVLPTGWSIVREGNHNNVLDQNGNFIFMFNYDGNVYHQDAYVSSISTSNLSLKLKR